LIRRVINMKLRDMIFDLGADMRRVSRIRDGRAGFIDAVMGIIVVPILYFLVCITVAVFAPLYMMFSTIRNIVRKTFRKDNYREDEVTEN